MIRKVGETLFKKRIKKCWMLGNPNNEYPLLYFRIKDLDLVVQFLIPSLPFPIFNQLHVWSSKTCSIIIFNSTVQFESSTSMSDGGKIYKIIPRSN